MPELEESLRYATTNEFLNYLGQRKDVRFGVFQEIMIYLNLKDQQINQLKHKN